MADLNFPLNPQTGDLYSLNGKTYRWDGQKMLQLVLWKYI